MNRKQIAEINRELMPGGSILSQRRGEWWLCTYPAMIPVLPEPWSNPEALYELVFHPTPEQVEFMKRYLDESRIRRGQFTNED